MDLYEIWDVTLVGYACEKSSFNLGSDRLRLGCTHTQAPAAGQSLVTTLVPISV